ncbi:MAG: hypothetical protein EHM13_06415 [Acidobacteria bacterium]|jgi:hypothetical protein|nr:MAG: hypothetical protein EHM13_06415 [Acidobacteriota bacterium]
MTVAEVERIGSPDISRQDARKAYLAYKAAVLKSVKPEEKKEYEGLWRGYKEIAAGKQVIDLGQALHAAGVQEDTLYPRLAICRADASKVRVVMKPDGSAVFVDEAARWRSRNAKRMVKLPEGTFPSYVMQWNGGSPYRTRPGGALERGAWGQEATALVPIVPPHLHPRGALGNFHILWDAVWTPAPPKDPLLLRHLAGSLYAIVAHWDLTPLEQAVMRGRL